VPVSDVLGLRARDHAEQINNEGKYPVQGRQDRVMLLLWNNYELLSPTRTTQLCKLQRTALQAVANPSRHYTLSVILGTVALSYGSVPMYKMVRLLDDMSRTSLLTSMTRFANRPAGVVNPSKLPYTRTPRTLLCG